MAGGALHPSVKRLEGSNLSCVPGTQFLDLGGDVRQRLGEFGLVLLGLPSGDLLTQGMEVIPLFGSIRTLIPSRFIVTLTQLHQPLLHLRGVHARKLLALQGGNFLSQCFKLVFQVLLCLPVGFALRLRKILLATQIGDALFQTPDFLPAPLEIDIRRE